MMNKRGQFYLIAAIIIVTVLIGYVSVTNYVASNEELDDIRLYELSKELKLEGESVVNYGIFNPVDLDVTLTQFTIDYGAYISDQETDVYFIYGNDKQIFVVGYINLEDAGGISLQVGDTPSIIHIDSTTTTREEINVTGATDLEGNLINPNVLITIKGTQYPFDISEGQNFFFIIRQPSGIGGAAGG